MNANKANDISVNIDQTEAAIQCSKPINLRIIFVA